MLESITVDGIHALHIPNKYIPDVLDTIANLSSDEVFTSPKLANEMLDSVPQQLFKRPDTKFLDPCCKSGVYLREIVKRLDKGLADAITDRQERIDHILKKQVFGIAITELTAQLSRRTLYCSKYACKIPADAWIDHNGKEHNEKSYSISEFDNSDIGNFFCTDPINGNIRFVTIHHVYDKNGICKFCGANKSTYDETNYAYEFIHLNDTKIKELQQMHFDLIIGNPPYQLSDGGGTNNMSAKPIYQDFVDVAKKLNPRYMSMIIPSRWFAGGKGLDKFRNSMLNDERISELYDYDNYKDVFQGLGGLAGGVCYFLWERDRHSGDCRVINHVEGGQDNVMFRKLNEYDIFIRKNKAVSIVKKITQNAKTSLTLDKRVSNRLPFGITTTYTPADDGVPCYFTQKIGLKYVKATDYTDANGYKDKWKFLIPKAPIAGQTDFSKPVGFYYDGNTRIAKPGEICTESWLVAGAFNTQEETESYKSYILTKTVRFLILQTTVSQNMTKKNFCFVPDLGNYKGEYNDDYLCKLWNITEDEWKYIDSCISNIDDKAKRY